MLPSLPGSDVRTEKTLAQEYCVNISLSPTATLSFTLVVFSTGVVVSGSLVWKEWTVTCKGDTSPPVTCKDFNGLIWGKEIHARAINLRAGGTWVQTPTNFSHPYSFPCVRGLEVISFRGEYDKLS